MSKENVLLRLFLLGVILCMNTVIKAQNNFNHSFNPMNGFVHGSEKPLRDELCLNGKWQFMPVFETDMAKCQRKGTFDLIAL